MDTESLTVETGLFNHTEVKPHFINLCCFGEDFAAWLRQQVVDLTSEKYELSEPIQEDYGWGFWVTRGRESYWIALSFCGEGPTEAPAEWVVSVAYDPGLSLVKRLFHTPDRAALSSVRERVWQVLRSTEGIRVVDDEEGGKP